MNKDRDFSNWLEPNAFNDNLVFVNPNVTRKELGLMASRVFEILKPLEGDRVAIAYESPILFLAAFIGIIYSGKIPVLFSNEPQSFLKFADHFDFAISSKCVPSIKKSVIWNGEKSQEIQVTKQDVSDRSFVLFTSGSTGSPKAVFKTVKMMDREADISCSVFGEKLRNSLLVSTVDPHHLYGLTFNIWMPMSMNVPICGKRAFFPEDIAGIDKTISLITSPTFLRNLDLGLKKPEVAFVLSAGGVLGDLDLQKASGWLRNEVNEIYGSTETGIVAYRKNFEGKPRMAWRLPEGMTVRQEGNEMLLNSPILQGEILLEDKLSLVNSREFHLLGRKDRVVKIGEKRFSLDEIEQRINGCSGLKAVVFLTEIKNRISLVAVLESSSDIAREELVVLKRQLRDKMSASAVPKFWRTVKCFPYNPQGKIEVSKLRELFHAQN